MKIQLKTKKNWLIMSAAILLLLYVVLMCLVVDTEYLVSNGSRNSILLESPVVVLLGAIIFAPILEEFIFRGYLTGNKYIGWACLMILGIYVIFKHNAVNVAAYSAFFIFFCIIKLRKNISPKEFLVLYNLLIISSSICFTVLHYKPSDFESITLASSMICQFAFGLLLSWIIINYSIVRAIIIHSLINITLLSVAYMLYTGEADTKTYTVENEKIGIEWKQSSSLFGSQAFMNNKDSIVAKQIRLENFYKMLEMLSGNTYHHQFKDQNPYDIKIYRVNANDSVNIIHEGNLLMPKTGLLKKE